ncbi:M23 family metallopeptidase [Novosphingobium sp. M1R2S20]|uniref:M23 family metallopeptidase n=1 Tax=Novosphingobium rhizovicinum TaxID=3228928 RepID=A0ABV3R6N3_9SPHN
MTPEWPGMWRAVAIAIALTSAFWVALGAWLFNDHINADHRSAQSLGAVKDAHGSKVGGSGILGGLTGAGPQSARPRNIPVGRQGAALQLPVAGVEADGLVDTFTQTRASGERLHDAIDIPAAEGTPVLAAAAGRIERLFQSEAGGNTIYVRSQDRRTIYYYAHLAQYQRGLREGQSVHRGERLGTVGSTGNASPEAPHLHFAIWQADPASGWHQNARAINPYPLLKGPSQDK